jgi:N-acetylmuramoyl-L-alanine amidase
MRDVKRIILHCTATAASSHIDVATVRKWHKKRGFSDCGYHYLLHLDGTIEIGRPVSIKGAHTKGANFDSIGVAYAGGLDDETREPKDTMTVRQEAAFMSLVDSLRTVFGYLTLHGHNEFSTKACPSFIVQEKFSFLI